MTDTPDPQGARTEALTASRRAIQGLIEGFERLRQIAADGEHRDLAARLEATATALEDNRKAVFEALIADVGFPNAPLNEPDVVIPPGWMPPNDAAIVDRAIELLESARTDAVDQLERDLGWTDAQRSALGALADDLRQGLDRVSG
jgi:hypothetical protein